MTVRPIARAINKPMLMFGLPRKLFAALGLAGAVIYEVLALFMSGPLIMIIPCALFAVLYYYAKRLYRKDDQIFEVALCSYGMSTAYDAYKRSIFTIEIIEVPEED